MKKYLFGLILLASAAISSCKKVDQPGVFDQTADQRLTASLAAYEAKLIGATNGWKGALTTNGGGIYTFYFKFNAANRVQMLSSFDSTSAVALKESSYRVKALQQPSLLFDTYSYIHVLSDPNNAISGGSGNAGLISDFEFYFEDTASTADKITLVGRFNGSSLVLTRATVAEATAFTTGQLGAGLQLNKILTYYSRIVINATDSADFRINPSTATITKPDATGNLMSASLKTSYILKLGGIGFLNPIVVGTKTVSEITDINYNTTTGVITAVIDGTAAVIKPVSTPIKIDAAAPKRWWQYAVDNGGSYYTSTSGVHRDGKDDFFDFNTTVPGLYYMHYWPRYNTSVGYDVFGLIYLNAAGTGLVQYATAPIPTFTTDGRVTYTYLGSLGTSPNAATTTKVAAAAPAVSLRTIISQPSGFYLVQTGLESYDMVSAFDGRTWISWTY